MPSHSRAPAKRERFAETPDAHERRILDLLLAQDGSTTRLCEAIAGGAIRVRVLRQEATDDVPDIIREHLPGTRFIERITSLEAHGEVMMDNLSYIALAGLEADIESDLLAGTMPIGHLLSRWWVRREWLRVSAELSQRLWSFAGLPDESATRSHRLDTPESPRMLIVETYRRGMLMDRR
jgi:chorismate-pyruvate lyase